ncbi:hypothetical protein [Acetonema longum]|uniref:Helix-turn-helix type 11 domain-containing protein n=1 Tax=Acetonema longum DSM 6540 TaxID=1009370 RepID=F7NKR0_9FIRM|nr:hypothetical protein [Acetonema longum]EGO63364.1 hypothetical protein ALO_13394 [Acetonema longum DSM 6540]
MKIGIVGPPEIVDKILRIIKCEFHQIKPTAYVYKMYTEAPKLLQNQQPYLDAVLFAGSTPLFYAEKYVKPVIAWEFIPRSGSSLLQVLLQIALSPKYSIHRLSSDLYDLNQLSETYQEIGVAGDQFQVFTTTKAPCDDHYIEYVCAFHEQHYRRRQISCCITALYNVHEALTAKNIPSFRVDPSANVIRQTLHKMQLNHLLQVSQQSQIVALSIRIDSPSEYSLFNDNEYQYIIDKTNVARQIYLFAQRIQAAVIEVGARDFLLFSTKHLVESVTNSFENIHLLQTVKENSASTVSIGVGYGQTAREAKSHASLGMDRASRQGGHAAFIVYNAAEIIGPVRTNDNKQQTDIKQKIDQKFLAVSERSGISTNTIFRLCSILESHGKRRFTASELAALLNVSLRTTNRLLAKLEEHGYCFEVGKRVLTQAGRPSRIVELRIP